MTAALRKPAMMLVALVTGICLWVSQTATSYADTSSSKLEKEWTQLYGDPANYNTPDHVAPTADGGFALLSDLTSRTFGPTSLHVIKTNASGGTEWETEFFDGIGPYFVLANEPGGRQLSGFRQGSNER